jgi:hypothetical protein
VKKEFEEQESRGPEDRREKQIPLREMLTLKKRELSRERWLSCRTEKTM